MLYCPCPFLTGQGQSQNSSYPAFFKKNTCISNLFFSCGYYKIHVILYGIYNLIVKEFAFWPQMNAEV